MKTIGIIALGGKCEQDKITRAKEYLERNSYNVVLSENISDENRYLAGTDEIKIKELHRFFLDHEIDIILNARGGYGSIRLINKIDYEIIKNNPKPFIGFSDITALLLMIYKKTGLITYHGPMACSDFGVSEYSVTQLKNALTAEKLTFEGDKIYTPGEAQGIIWGGNLSTVVSLCGQNFIPEEDFIFFTEDLNEPVYKIDKMFTQLFNIENFKKYCKGIVLGDFLNIDNEMWLEELFLEFNLPTVGGFKITHSHDKVTIPIGKSAILRNNHLIINI